jgi:hypothetical protein
MSARSARLSAVGFLICILLPLTVPASHLDDLLTAHDVRNAIHQHTGAERGR